MKHTPGPWKVSHGRRGKLGQSADAMEPFTMIQTDYHSTGRIKNGSEAMLCELKANETAFDIGVTNYQHRIDTDEAESNAHLIAAAPDLLAALEDIVARNEIQDWFNLDKARAAIAKARAA